MKKDDKDAQPNVMMTGKRQALVWSDAQSYERFAAASPEQQIATIKTAQGRDSTLEQTLPAQPSAPRFDWTKELQAKAAAAKPMQHYAPGKNTPSRYDWGKFNNNSLTTNKLQIKRDKDRDLDR